MLFDSVRILYPRLQARFLRLIAHTFAPTFQICNSQWFVKTSMILFLNKDDVRSPILLFPFLVSPNLTRLAFPLASDLPRKDHGPIPHPRLLFRLHWPAARLHPGSRLFPEEVYPTEP